MKNIFPLIYGLAALPLAAATLTPEQALARLGDSGVQRAPSMNALSLVYTGNQPESNNPAYYVFANDGLPGFMILSADDKAMPLLARVDKGAFDPENMPPAVNYWLEEYARQIEFAATSPAPIPTSSSRKAIFFNNRHDVEPICKTKWGQGRPFNNMTPEYGGRHAVVGCVATAMAQAMKVYNWPESGKGAIIYNYKDETLSMDFSETHFDWENMLDDYSSSTQTEKDAVATLSKACGYATQMRYGTNDSGTYVTYISGALYNYFNYELPVILQREGFSTAQWEEMMYEEMQAGRPVVYSGSTTMGTGHTFICDGYSTDGLFHINWGWEGSYDGYFRLSALNPQGTGIGGGAGQYNFMQNAVVCIAPKGTKDLPKYQPFYARGNFMIDTEEYPNYGTKKFYFDDGYLICNTAVRFSAVNMGVILYKDGVQVTEWAGASGDFLPINEYGSLSGYGSYTVPESINGLDPGVYALYPGVRIRNFGWYKVPVYQGFNQCVYMTVGEDRSITYSNTAPKYQPDLEIDCEDSGICYPTIGGSGAELDLTFRYRNGELPFKGTIYVVARDEDGVERSLFPISCDYERETQGTTTIMVDVPIELGTYQAWFVDESGTPLSSEFALKVDQAIYVESIDSDSMEEPQYFDLQGRRLKELPEGVGVMRDINGAKKVIK